MKIFIKYEVFLKGVFDLCVWGGFRVLTPLPMGADSPRSNRRVHHHNHPHAPHESKIYALARAAPLTSGASRAAAMG